MGAHTVHGQIWHQTYQLTTCTLYNPYNMEKLFEYASEYAKGYADVGYDED